MALKRKPYSVHGQVPYIYVIKQVFVCSNFRNYNVIFVNPLPSPLIIGIAI